MTPRRGALQLKYKQQNDNTPAPIRKAIRTTLADQLRARQVARQAIHATEDEFDTTELLAELEAEMYEAAEKLEFERAAVLRDRIETIKGSAEAAAVEDRLNRPPKKTGRKGRKGRR